MTAETQPNPSPCDFLAVGAPSADAVLRFRWTVDNDTLKDVNRASGMDSTASHTRGFLARLALVWSDTPEERRPRLEVPSQLSEDLVYIPSPCYIFAISDDGSTVHCWYSVLVDASCAELLEGRAGVRIFTLTGDPETVWTFLDGTLRQFRFRTKAKHGGYTFHRRV